MVTVYIVVIVICTGGRSTKSDLFPCPGGGRLSSYVVNSLRNKIMFTVQTFNSKSTFLSVVVLGSLLSFVIPFVASAQGMPDRANAGIERGAAAANNERAAAQIESMRAQVAALQSQLEAMQNAQNRGAEARPEQVGRDTNPASVDRLQNLPEQASDRAREVMQCLQLGRSLGLGSRGVDVQQIQEFLREKGFFNFPTATGYFGRITQAAVEEFQTAQGIVSGGSPETTGFGNVGPRTQAAIAQTSCLNEERAMDSDMLEEVEAEEEVDLEVDDEEEQDEETDSSDEDEVVEEDDDVEVEEVDEE